MAQGQWVRGIVDEVQRHPLTGALTLVEHKTRARPAVPSAAQQGTAQLQAMLYRALLEGLQHMKPAEVGSTLVHYGRLCT